MDDNHQDTWAGVLFALLLVGILLGGLLILSLTGTLAHCRQPSSVRREGSALAWVHRHGAQVTGQHQRVAALPAGDAKGAAGALASSALAPEYRVFVSLAGLSVRVRAPRELYRPAAKVNRMPVIRSYSRHVDGADAEYQGTITAFSESSSL
jgi:hypothetical protein